MPDLPGFVEMPEIPPELSGRVVELAGHQIAVQMESFEESLAIMMEAREGAEESGVGTLSQAIPEVADSISDSVLEQVESEVDGCLSGNPLSAGIQRMLVITFLTILIKEVVERACKRLVGVDTEEPLTDDEAWIDAIKYVHGEDIDAAQINDIQARIREAIAAFQDEAEKQREDVLREGAVAFLEKSLHWPPLNIQQHDRCVALMPDICCYEGQYFTDALKTALVDALVMKSENAMEELAFRALVEKATEAAVDIENAIAKSTARSVQQLLDDAHLQISTQVRSASDMVVEIDAEYGCAGLIHPDFFEQPDGGEHDELRDVVAVIGHMFVMSKLDRERERLAKAAQKAGFRAEWPPACMAAAEFWVAPETNTSLKEFCAGEEEDFASHLAERCASADSSSVSAIAQQMMQALVSLLASAAQAEYTRFQADNGACPSVCNPSVCNPAVCNPSACTTSCAQPLFTSCTPFTFLVPHESDSVADQPTKKSNNTARASDSFTPFPFLIPHESEHVNQPMEESNDTVHV